MLQLLLSRLAVPLPRSFPLVHSPGAMQFSMHMNVVGLMQQRLFATGPLPRVLRAPTLTVVDVRPRGAVQTTAAAVSAPPTSSISAPLQQSISQTSVNGFGALGLNQQLQAALEVLNVKEPTEIQSLAIPAIISGGNYFLASHTGSGKTLGYLLPLIQLIKAQEADGFVSRPKRPRVLILGPTKELTEQITGVAKQLCHHAKFRVVCLNSNRKRGEQKLFLAGPVDVVVATPTRFLQHVSYGNVYFRDIQHLVVDEADTMFAQGWGDELKSILKPVTSKPEPASVILVSATMTKEVKRLVTGDVQGVRTLETTSMHKAVVGSRHQFLSLPPSVDKLQQLAELLEVDSKRKRKVLVFCNTIDSCRAVEHHCRDVGALTVCYHGEMPAADRKASMAKFAAASVDDQDGLPIMIATDLAARGLDFPGQVDHVINFDFPTNPIDYIHRTGRTARAGATGKITSLVAKRDKVLAQRVEWALTHDEALDELSADRDVLPPSQLRMAARRDHLADRKTPSHTGRGAAGGKRLGRPARGAAASAGGLVRGGLRLGRGGGRAGAVGVAGMPGRQGGNKFSKSGDAAGSGNKVSTTAKNFWRSGGTTGSRTGRGSSDRSGGFTGPQASTSGREKQEQDSGSRRSSGFSRGGSRENTRGGPGANSSASYDQSSKESGSGNSGTYSSGRQGSGRGSTFSNSSKQASSSYGKSGGPKTFAGARKYSTSRSSGASRSKDTSGSSKQAYAGRK